MLGFRFSSVNFTVFIILISQHLIFKASAYKVNGKSNEEVANYTAFQESRISKEMQMLSYMDESVDPCNDFYKFACGKWPQVYPADGLISSTFGNMHKEHDTIVGRLLKAGVEAEDSELDTKIKDFYASCIRFSSQVANRTDYQEKLRDIIANVGEMPALYGDAWQAEKFNWLETVAELAGKYNKATLISLDIMPDFANNTKNRLYIAYPEFHLSTKSMYVDDEAAPDRKKYKEEIALKLEEYLGCKRGLAQQTANEIVEFETSLAHGMVDDKLGESLGDLSKLTTVQAMSEKYAPTLNIEKLINLTIGKEVNELIYEYAESYHRNLVKVLESTPKRIVANYIFYQLIDGFLLNVTNPENNIEARCLEKTTRFFAKHLENMLYRHHNTSSIANEITVLWLELKQTFASELQSKRLDWIATDTQQKMIEKLTAMELEISSFEEHNLTEEFEGLQIHRDDFLRNIKNILRISSQNFLSKLEGPPQPIGDGDTLLFTPVNVVLENRVKIPLIVLLSNIQWDSSSPTAVKFAALGTVLAHELIHGFDDNGQQYDKRGNLLNWWDEASATDFAERTLCFVDQYSNYSYGGRLLPRSALQMENIADNGSVRSAYALYLRWLEEASKKGMDLSAETFPSMNYTSKQLFFISFAQIWCSDADPSVFNQQTSDVHVPEMFRVLGPLSNYAEFAQEFSCEPGSPMNPIKKCEIF